MPVSNPASENPAKSAEGNDSTKNSVTAKSDNPLLREADLSNPANSAQTDNVFWSRKSQNMDVQSYAHNDLELKAMLAAHTGNQTTNGFGISGLDRENPDLTLDKYKVKNNSQNPDSSEQKERIFRYIRTVVIKLEAVDDALRPQVGPKKLEEAKEAFLESFKKNGGDSRTARYYINNMIKIQHDKAEYAKLHPDKKVYYVGDRDLAACINELAKVPGAKRTGTASTFSNREINDKLLRLVGTIGVPEENINQGQIGSCALHAGIGYIIEKDPKHIARVGSQILRTGEYRGGFTREDMSAAEGQNDINHMLGVAMRRNVYQGQHLDGSYGGTDTDNLKLGIKRMTWGQVSVVWSPEKTMSNGANLDLTYGDSHCQRSICRVFKENGQLVMKKKTDNTWSGFQDGRWTTIR